MRCSRGLSLLLILSWGSPASSNPVRSNTSDIAENMTPERWLRVTSRLEIASTEIADAANTIASIANEIEAAGRLSRMTQLSGYGEVLEQRIIQAQMAADEMLYP